MRVTLCGTCALGRSGFAEALGAALGVDVALLECMSGCSRPSTVAFRAEGKTAYLFGDVVAEDLPDLVTFARMYRESADGNFADARPLGALRTKAVARIPG